MQRKLPFVAAAPAARTSTPTVPLENKYTSQDTKRGQQAEVVFSRTNHTRAVSISDV